MSDLYLLIFLSLSASPSIARRDHIYTVDTDTANSDEIFFSKVSETSAIREDAVFSASSD